VGGGLSNGALFMGTARYGSAADIVVGMEVVDAGGRLIQTGQAAFLNGRPGFRQYGPDLTGLFVHDAGALGVKTSASLRMMPMPEAADYASFAFATQQEAIHALSLTSVAAAIARRRISLIPPPPNALSTPPR